MIILDLLYFSIIVLKKTKMALKLISNLLKKYES